MGSGSLKVIESCTIGSADTDNPTLNQTLRRLANRLRSYAIFTVRRYALHGLSYRNSVRPSVCPSVCLSVTLVHCVHMVQPTITIFSPYGSHIILVSEDIKFIPKFEGDHPERGR